MRWLLLSAAFGLGALAATVYLIIEGGRVARDAGRGFVFDSVARDRGFRA